MVGMGVAIPDGATEFHDGAGRTRERKGEPMSKKLLLTCGLIVATLTQLGLAAVIAEEAGTKDRGEEPECRVVLQPESLRSKAEWVRLHVLLPDRVGAALRGQAEPDSGIRVVEVDTRSTGVTVVALDTSDSAAGEWQIRLDAEHGACAGSLTIESG